MRTKQNISFHTSSTRTPHQHPTPIPQLQYHNKQNFITHHNTPQQIPSNFPSLPSHHPTSHHTPSHRKLPNQTSPRVQYCPVPYIPTSSQPAAQHRLRPCRSPLSPWCRVVAWWRRMRAVPLLPHRANGAELMRYSVMLPYRTVHLALSLCSARRGVVRQGEGYTCCAVRPCLVLCCSTGECTCSRHCTARLGRSGQDSTGWVHGVRGNAEGYSILAVQHRTALHRSHARARHATRGAARRDNGDGVDGR